MREFINGADFRDMLLVASASLNFEKQRLNELNVFPVPDGDTGTNMSMTMSAAATELRKKSGSDLSDVADTAASAMLRGARGNSGVILSLLFRGFARRLKGLGTADAAAFAGALTAGVEAAYKAVMKPAEGTILTVSKKAAAAATEFARGGGDLELLLVCALEAAKAALAETIDQNPVLKKAGVVDAGGCGYVVILDAMLAFLQGRSTAVEQAPEKAETSAVAADFSAFDEGDINFTYCTELIIRKAGHKSADLLRAFLDSLGDCVVVVEDDEIIKTHTHTNEPGKLLSEAVTYGPLIAVKIENMREQHSQMSGESDGAPKRRPPAPPEKKFGVVAVCAGEGITQLFRELGADRTVSGGQTMNPSTEDILKEIEQTPAEVVFVLPNNKNIIMAAEQCIPLSSDKKVVVIPTKTVPQGISALLHMEDSEDEAAVAGSLATGAYGTHTALVTFAARDSDFDGHAIKAGEYLALLDGALVGNYTDTDVLFSTLNRAMENLPHEFITVYYGEGADKAGADAVGERMAERFPDSEVSVVDGGQPVYSYMIAAE